MDKTPCRVIFKMTPIRLEYENELESECVAFLLDVDANDGYVMSYMHVGQHGEAQIGWFNSCKLASPEQYKDLKWELENLIGYNLKIRSRWNRR